MLKNRLLLSLVTGGVGFGLSLLILRDLKMAAYTGLMGFVGSQAAVLVTSSQHEEHLRDRREELRSHIRSLQRRRSEVYTQLTSLQSQCSELRQQQVPVAPTSEGVSDTGLNPWSPRTASTATPRTSAALPVSWNLTEPRRSSADIEVDDLTQRIQALSDEEEALQASITEDLNAKQKAELHRTTSEAELQQLQAQISEQVALKQALNQTILELEEQQQQLQANIPELQRQIQALELRRTEAETPGNASSQTHASANDGAVALQSAIDQMQSQIEALRTELGELETQILDRRHQKQQLDQELALQQHNQLHRGEGGQETLDRSMVAGTTGNRSKVTQSKAATTRKTKRSPEGNKTVPTPPTATRLPAAMPPEVTSQPVQVELTVLDKPKTPTPDANQDQGLATEWTVFRRKLQPYEFQALCAIALEENPTSVLKHLAETNLTMPEMLIDTINEQALEIIGDLILEAGRDAASTIIAQEYRDEVATLIATQR